jgi:hypothetical protein
MPIPTVKFYLREGLLPPGTPTARNRARYDDTHLDRLRLIRVLTTVGGLEIGAVRDLLAVVEDPEATLAEVYEGIEKVGLGAPYPADVDGVGVPRPTSTRWPRRWAGRRNPPVPVASRSRRSSPRYGSWVTTRTPRSSCPSRVPPAPPSRPR